MLLIVCYVRDDLQVCLVCLIQIYVLFLLLCLIYQVWILIFLVLENFGVVEVSIMILDFSFVFFIMSEFF